MNRRWLCPNGLHPGVNAPSKPRRKDIRRYCIECSVESGELVERVVPALERRREESRAKSAEKTKEKIARVRSAWTLDDGTNIKRALTRARKLKVWGVQLGTRGATRAKSASVEIRIGWPRGHHGRAWGAHRAHVHLRRDHDGREAILTLLHEIAHLALDNTALEANRPHGRNFHMILLEAAKEWWPELHTKEQEILKHYVAEGGSNAAYSMDAAISRQLTNYRATMTPRGRAAAAEAP